MNKSKNAKPQAVHTISDAPGGYLPSEQLDRANAFASMRLALEGALSGDRNAVIPAVREAIGDFAPEFLSHAAAMTEIIGRAEVHGRLRDVESAVAEMVRFFAAGESATLTTAPKHPDETQIQAAALARINLAKAEQFRVRTKNF